MGDSTFLPIKQRPIKKEYPTPKFSLSDYMENLQGPIDQSDLHYMLDYKDRKVLSEYNNFDAKHLMKCLTGYASTANTPPTQFWHEMEFLVTYRDQEVDCETNYHSRPGWEKKLIALRKKYLYCESGCGKDDITGLRLCILFPHFCDIQQKPLHSFKPNFLNLQLLCQHPEFGGLIPTCMPESSDEVKRLIITAHIYSLSNAVTSSPLRLHCALLKVRIEKSQLSDERRMIFLENNSIITKQGTLTSTMNMLLTSIGAETFQYNIHWDLIY